MANDAKNTGDTPAQNTGNEVAKTPAPVKKPSSNEPIAATYVGRDRSGNKSAPVYKLACDELPSVGDKLTIKTDGLTVKVVVRAVNGTNVTAPAVAKT